MKAIFEKGEPKALIIGLLHGFKHGMKNVFTIGQPIHSIECSKCKKVIYKLKNQEQ